METSVISVLVLAAFGLLVAATGGIIYLSAAEWRDRRLQDRESRAESPAKPAKPAKSKKR